MKRIIALGAAGAALLAATLLLWPGGEKLPPPPRPPDPASLRGAPPPPLAEALPAAPDAPPSPPPSPGRTVRWKVVPGERPIPRDGSPVAVGPPGSPPDRAGRMEGDLLVCEDLPPQYRVLLAAAEDGSLASLFLPPAGTEPTEPVAFLRPRRVEILLRDEDGDPVEAIGIGMGSHGRDRGGRVVPLEGGRAVVEGLLPSETGHGFWLLDDFNRDSDGFLLGFVDVTNGDARLERVVPRPRDVALRVRVDGSPRIPEKWNLLAGLQTVGMREIDDAAAEIRFRIRPWIAGSASLRMMWSSPGLRPESSLLDARWDPAGAVFRAAIDLVTPASLVLEGRVTGNPLPESVCLDVRGKEGWVPAAPRTAVPPDGCPRFSGLDAGTYRLRDPATGVAGDPVELRAGGEATAHLATVPAALVRGRVLAPAWARPGDVRVLVEGPSVDTSIEDPFLHPGYRVAGDLGFEVPVPEGVPVTLRAWHPLLAPAAGKVPAEVSGAAEGLLLRLVEERVASFRPRPHWAGALGFTARLYRGEAAGEPAAAAPVRGAGGGGRVGGVGPGRVHHGGGPPEFAPRVVEGVDLGEGATDLGEVQFEAGTVLTVRLRLPQGTPWPGLDVLVRPLTGPGFMRWVPTTGEKREAVVPGLPAGRLSVLVRVGGLLAEFKEEVEVDGVSPALLEVDAAGR